MLVLGKFTSGWGGIYVRTGRQRGADRPRMEGTVNSYRHTFAKYERAAFQCFSIADIVKSSLFGKFSNICLETFGSLTTIFKQILCDQERYDTENDVIYHQ